MCLDVGFGLMQKFIEAYWCWASKIFVHLGPHVVNPVVLLGIAIETRMVDIVLVPVSEIGEDQLPWLGTR